MKIELSEKDRKALVEIIDYAYAEAEYRCTSNKHWDDEPDDKKFNRSMRTKCRRLWDKLQGRVAA